MTSVEQTVSTAVDLDGVDTALLMLLGPEVYPDTPPPTYPRPGPVMTSVALEMHN
jgi:hypothetical protein